MMKRSIKRSLFLLVVVIIGISNLASATQENVYTYVSLATGTSMRLDENSHRIILDQHSVIGTTDCPQNVDFKCLLIDKEVVFVFPTGPIDSGKSWRYENATFKVIKKLNSQVLGEKYSTFLVQRQWSKGEWYLFSPINGLLAFGVQTEEFNSTFILEGRCGFAATQTCLSLNLP
jgi:hypothetical protein